MAALYYDNKDNSNVHLLPLSHNHNEKYCEYAGFINVLDHSYRLSLLVPTDGDLSKTHIECDWRLQSCMRNELDVIQQKLNGSTSLNEFLKSFTDIAEKCLKENGYTPKHHTVLNHKILQQIQEIGWKKVHSLSDDISTVEFGCFDSCQRLHKLKVVFNKEIPLAQAPPRCVTDLPLKFDFHWSHDAHLKDLLTQFEACLSNYQEFWDCVEEIDQNTWVLEPENPTFSCNYRRIALGQNLSIHIVINTQQPSSLPECRILGAESVVAPLREKLNVNLHHWDVDRSLLNNLQEVLEIDFPTPSDTNKEELTVECGICYSHQLEDEIPEIVCQYAQCSQAFHYSCLYEWLRNSSCRQSFNYIFGECPFCSKPMRVKIQLE